MRPRKIVLTRQTFRTLRAALHSYRLPRAFAMYAAAQAQYALLRSLRRRGDSLAPLVCVFVANNAGTAYVIDCITVGTPSVICGEHRATHNVRHRIGRHCAAPRRAARFLSTACRSHFSLRASRWLSFCFCACFLSFTTLRAALGRWRHAHRTAQTCSAQTLSNAGATSLRLQHFVHILSHERRAHVIFAARCCCSQTRRF